METMKTDRAHHVLLLTIKMTSLQADNVVESIAPSNDLGKIERLRRISEVSRDESDKKNVQAAQWRESLVETTVDKQGDASPVSTITADIKELSQDALHLLKVAACLETLNVQNSRGSNRAGKR